MIRDDKSKALLNNDLESFNKYKRERENIRKLDYVIKEIDSLKNDIKNIYALLERKEK